MPSGGGGVGNRVDDSWNGGIVSIPKDSYRNVKQISQRDVSILSVSPRAYLWDLQE